MGQRIVIASLGSYGDVNPYIGLALGLQQRGHRVTIATSPFYRPAVEQEGIAFRAVRPDVDPNDRQILRRAMNARTGTEFIIRELIVRHLRESYEDLDDACQEADLLVTHPITFAGPIVAAARNLKWVSTVLAPMSLFSAHDLPVFPNAPWIHRFGQLGLRSAPAAGVALQAVRPLLERAGLRSASRTGTFAGAGSGLRGSTRATFGARAVLPGHGQASTGLAAQRAHHRPDFLRRSVVPESCFPGPVRLSRRGSSAAGLYPGLVRGSYGG